MHLPKPRRELRLLNLFLVFCLVTTLAAAPTATYAERSKSVSQSSEIPIGKSVATQSTRAVVPTNEWVNFYGFRVMVNGQSAPAGTSIRAYNPRGVLAGEFVVSEAGTYGLMAVYRDDPATDEDDGLRPGESVSFTIDGETATPFGQDAPIWTASGDLKRVDLAIGALPPEPATYTVYLPILNGGQAAAAKGPSYSISEAALLLPLSTGWNLVSFPVAPSNPDPSVVLSSIAGLFSVVLSYDRGGLSYYPTIPPNMNTLRSMNGHRGYWIKMNSPGTLAITGPRLPENDPIPLYPGWNLVSYLPLGSKEVGASLASIANQYSVVLGYDAGALSYYPTLPDGLNTLRSLNVNRAYWIKMNSAGTLVYSAASQTATPVPTATPFLTLPPTPTPVSTPAATPTIGPRINPIYPPSIISSDAVWRPSDGTYVINNTVTVNQRVKLTIEPGTVIKFQDRAGLIVNGTLSAGGTASAPIIFTSIHDDSYAGDTNSNGGWSVPGASNWGNIYLSSTSASSYIKHARITYGGAWNEYYYSQPWEKPALLYASGSSPLLENLDLQYGTTYGLLLENSSNAVLRDSRITHVAGTGVRINSSSAPIIENNTVESNSSYALYMEASAAPRLAGNRAQHNGVNGVGVSGTIAPSVTWDSDLPYVIDGGLTINAGVGLTLRHGAVIKFKGYANLNVNGTLQATGLVTSPIVFTSLKDDTVGGDTNNDGFAGYTLPAPGDWQGITFANSSTNSNLEYAVVRYGGRNNGANVTINGSAPVIRHSYISFSQSDGLRLSNVAMPEISDSTVSDNNDDGLEMLTSSAPTLVNNGFVNNGSHALRMEGNSYFTGSGNTASNNMYDGAGVSGTVPANSTWIANLPYILDNVTVNTGIVLTLQPGVVVKLRSGNFMVKGVLRAVGTEGSKIVFTSVNDSSTQAGGQILGRLAPNSLEPALAAGDWGRIEFASTSSASVLDHVLVRYGGGGSYGSIYLNGAAPSISNSTISHSSGHGLYVSGSSPAIMNSYIVSNGNSGVYAANYANPVIQNNFIHGNSQYGVYNQSSGSVTIDATNNWWGQASGPNHSSNPLGTGDRVSNGINFTPWMTSTTQPTPTPLPSPTPTPVVNYVNGAIAAHTTWTLDKSPYVVNGDITVNNGVILSVQPGVVIKFQSGRRITLNGILASSGTPENPIVFTSIQDDLFGGDTNLDGSRSKPSAGQWEGIYLNASSSASVLAHVLFRYASTALRVSGASPTINNAMIMFSGGSAISVTGAGSPTIQSSIIRDGNSVGISLSGSSPTILNNVFVNNGDAVISMDGNSLPQNSGNQAYYNRVNGIRVSGTVNTRGTWHSDLPYVVESGGVGTGVVLTIEPGTVIKVNSGDFNVNGGLVANGTSVRRIVFTSIHDDSFGDDTNNNGSQTWPSSGDWSRINFTASSLSSSSLTYADVAYGGVKVTGASPTIANNRIMYASGYGLEAESLAAPTIRDNKIQYNRHNGLHIRTSSAPNVQNNQFVGNWGYAIYMQASSTPTLIGNTSIDNRIEAVGVSGNASASTLWKANLPYVIEGMTIDSGVSLTLEPGAILKLREGADIVANGNLVALGTADDQIVVTSLRDDDIGGDTNNDGKATAPAAGDWNTIRFASSSTASKLNNVVVRYGGGPTNPYWNYERANIFLDGAAVPIENTELSHSFKYGLKIENANPAITSVDVNSTETAIYLESAHVVVSNSTIRDNSQYGINGNSSNPEIISTTVSSSVRGVHLSSTSEPYPNITGNTFANNREYAAYLDANALSRFGKNSFVGSVGNAVKVRAGTLTKDATLYDGTVYALSHIDIEQTATLRGQAGAVVKMESSAALVVNGTLEAAGTSEKPIVFTSLKDDAYGGDTNADGAASGPAAQNWAAIYFAPTSGTSFVEHAVVKYAGGYFYNPWPSYYSGAGVSINNSSPTINNSTISNNGGYGILLNGASSSISNNTIDGQSYAVWASGSSFPTIISNTISSSSAGVHLEDSVRATVRGNTFGTNPTAVSLKADGLPLVGENSATSSRGNAISVRDGTIDANTTLYPGLVYALRQTTVSAGVVLSIRPGTVIKLGNSGSYWDRGYLLVRGQLLAQGTAVQKIVFTAWRDDTYGGDTNNDGSSSSPSPGYWGGIYLSTSDSKLDHTVVKYGGQQFSVDGTTYYAAIILNNVSPSISNSTIARSNYDGIRIINSNPSITDNDIWGNTYGIYTQSGARPTIRRNIIRDNSTYGIYNADTSLVIDATNNSWGHDSGPSPVGAGDRVNYSDANNQRTYWVAFDPWNGKTHWIEQNLGVLRQWVAYVAEPVNTATGNYVYEYQDLRVPGRGLSLEFHRYYNSHSTYQGAVGYGWTFNYGMTVREEDGNALVMNEDGRVDKYLPDGSGGYIAPKGVYASLSKSGSAFALKRKDQTVYSFDTSGRLSSIADRNGNTVSLAYTAGKLSGVTDPTGRALAVTYDGNNRITRIGDPLGREISFAYDELGNLISVTDARGNVTRYAYDSKHRMITITDPNNHVFVTNVYDDKDRVQIQRDARLDMQLGNTTFSYDANSRVTVVTDPRGYATAYAYDAELRLQSERNAAGQTVSYGYDHDNNRNRVTDRRGNTTHYAYDAMGNTTVITDALGAGTSFGYDSMNNPTRQMDVLGRATTHAYDGRGNLVSTVDPLGNTTTLNYDSNGLMVSTTDANGQTSMFGYDSHGNRISVRDPMSNTITSTYDLGGRKLTETDALGRTTSYSYDANNNVLTITDAEGGVTRHTYDAVGNRLTIADPLGRVTTQTFDKKDKLSTVTNAMGGVTRYEYDANDNKIRETDALTRTTSFGYDSLNRLTQTTDALGKTTVYGYDVDGNRTSVADANGRTTVFTYDAVNRLTRATDPLLNVTSYFYDAVGNRIRVMDPNGYFTNYDYDGNNRLVRVTDAMGGVVQYNYDGVGNRTRVTDANGHVTTVTYDQINRVSSETDPLGNEVRYAYDAVGNRTGITNSRGQTTSFTYDALNRLIGVGYPDSTVTYAYDAVGNRTRMVDPTGVTTYTYDVLNRATDVNSPGGAVGYVFDAVGNRTSIVYPDGKTVGYVYDGANRLIRVTDWLSRETTYGYDNVGNLTSQNNPNNTSTSHTYDAANRLVGLIHTSSVSGTIASFSYTLDKVGNRTRVVDTEGITTYEYDKLYRLTAVTYPNATSASYQYDPMGNRTVMTTTLGVTRYNYDAADRVTAAGPITFAWDADGNMLTKGAASYTYDAANRLTRVVSGALDIGYSYNGASQRVSKTVNGVATNFTYSIFAGLPHVLIEGRAGENITYTYGVDLIAQTSTGGMQSYYHNDGLGSSRTLSNGSGQVTGRYSYDAFGAVQSSSGISSKRFGFTGEQSDDEIGLIYLRARYYDPQVGRFISRDPFPGLAQLPQTLNPYVYAVNNPVNLTDPDGDIAPLLVLGVVAGGAFFGATSQYVSDVIDNYAMGRRGWDTLRPTSSPGDYFASAVGGAVGAPVGFFGGGPVLGGVASGATRSLLKNGFTGKLPSMGELALEVGYDAIPGLLMPGGGRFAAKLGSSKFIDFGLGELARIGLQADARLIVWLGSEMISATGSDSGQKTSRLHDGSFRQSLNEFASHTSSVGGASTSVYTQLSRRLQQAGFNPAKPQRPPSGSK